MRLIQVAEAAKRLGVSRQTLENWGKNGTLKIRTIGKPFNSHWVDADTIEVKDVDLKQEINKYIQDNIIGFCVPGTEETAKHFFELGLKAQKGE